jgi:hypothetical protein
MVAGLSRERSDALACGLLLDESQITESQSGLQSVDRYPWVALQTGFLRSFSNMQNKNSEVTENMVRFRKLSAEIVQLYISM